MKRTIHYFGDSHTAGIGNVGAPPGCDYIHKPYSEYLTELLNIPYRNYAWGGKPFMKNVEEFTKYFDTFKKGDIVLFQIQFLCNSILSFENDRSYIVSAGHLMDEEERREYGFSMEDSLTLLDWTNKFEERRSIYDLYSVINLLRYLRTKGVETHLLYWLKTYTIDLPDNELLLKFDGVPYVCNGKVPTIKDATNGIWDDAHTPNEFNEELAHKIYNIING